MAVRSFPGTAANESLIFLPGALNGVTPGPWTAAILYKRVTDSNTTTANALFCISGSVTNTSNNFNSKFWFLNTSASTGNVGEVAFVDSTNTTNGSVTVVNADGWVVFVVTKASGTATPRFHLRKLTAATTTRGNGAGTLANGSVIASTDRVEFGKDEYFNRSNGLIALAGIWNVALTDAQVDELWANLKTTDWRDNSGGTPLAYWEFNQDSVTTAVVDLSGGGANETARTGTSVVTGDDPPGWTFGIVDNTTKPATKGLWAKDLVPRAWF
jgi:hypothetical protein